MNILEDTASSIPFSASLQEAQQHIADLELQISYLTKQLDREKSYYLDKETRTFKVWLRKQPPAPFIRRLLADTRLPPCGRHTLYEVHLRQTGYSPTDIHQFVELWKQMLSENQLVTLFTHEERTQHHIFTISQPT